jgi:hypothetical protein
MNAQKITTLLKPLVTSRIYKDEESALRNIILDFAEKKEDYYKKIIDGFEKKYKYNFEKYNKKIMNTATMEQEEIWMDWKIAIEMEKAWNTAMKQIIES